MSRVLIAGDLAADATVGIIARPSRRVGVRPRRQAPNLNRQICGRSAVRRYLFLMVAPPSFHHEGNIRHHEK
jgi:hypothetical protein